MSAEFSACGRYRYTLERDLGLVGVGTGAVLFVMLNPSIADAEQDDPTIRRCIEYAKAWGFNRLLVGNVYAFRATNPSDMLSAEDPVGPDCDKHLRALARRASAIVCAWGYRAQPERVRVVHALLASYGATYALATTHEAEPRHPLYLRKTLRPLPWRPGVQLD